KISADDLLLNSFFVSSRRRHTRWPRDWSSDVCSSDLASLRAAWVKPDYPDSPRPPEGLQFEPPIQNVGPGGLLGDHPMYSLAPRSEERRVGKECRTRRCTQSQIQEAIVDVRSREVQDR